MGKPLIGTSQVWLQQPNGQPLAVFEKNSADAETTLIFVHGTPATGSAFHAQMEQAFVQTNRLTYDRPGFGASPGTPAATNLDYQTETLRKIIAHVTTPRVVLVGHSYGAPLALQAAAREPHRVSGVMLIGGSVDPAQEKPWRIQYFGASPWIAWLLPTEARMANEELLHLKSDLIALDQLLPKLTCPVLMVHGTEDQQVPLDNVAYLQKRYAELGHASLFHSTILTGYNHFMMWEQPETVNREIEHFLQLISLSPL
jgi:pimeloyl-ACP methyl ester carboxylesterase